jgi:hypothetical protein
LFSAYSRLEIFFRSNFTIDAPIRGKTGGDKQLVALFRFQAKSVGKSDHIFPVTWSLRFSLAPPEDGLPAYAQTTS